jgi:hypothetical protein
VLVPEVARPDDPDGVELEPVAVLVDVPVAAPVAALVVDCASAEAGMARERSSGAMYRMRFSTEPRRHGCVSERYTLKRNSSTSPSATM